MSRGTKVARICRAPGCGCGFTARLCDVHRGGGRFCSKRCAALARQREVINERNRGMRQARIPPPPLLQHGHQQLAAGRLQDIETTAELRTSGPEFDFTEDVTP